jgi:hypothetical protein
MVSEQTRELISKKAKLRPGSLTGKTGEDHPRYKGGYARDITKRSNADYVWINAVKALYKKECFLSKNKTNLVCHHLYSWNSYPDKRYAIENGVCITKTIHKQFHNEYGYGNNTEEQFADFCLKHYNIDWYRRKNEFI